MQMLDRPGRRLGYFHNAGYFELEGDDFDGIFYLPEGRNPLVLLPYIELVKLDRVRHDDDRTLLTTALVLTREHLERRPATNPMPRLRARIEADLDWLAQQGDDAFHPYAFATCRQCGANAEVAAAFVDWLDQRDGGGLAKAADAFRSIASVAKGLQFSLARAARGRSVDLAAPFAEIEEAWDTAMGMLVERYAS
jgi:hypothetical protein